MTMKDAFWFTLALVWPVSLTAMLWIIEMLNRAFS